MIVSTGIALNGTTSVQITIPATTFNNGETFGLYLAQPIANNGTPLPVEIVMNGTAYPLLKPCGNNVMSDQLRSQRQYPVRVGTNPNHFTVKCSNLLAGTSFVAPQLVPTAEATAGQEALCLKDQLDSLLVGWCSLNKEINYVKRILPN